MSAPRRILIVTERFFPEEFIVNELAAELAREAKVTVLTQNPSYPFDRLFVGYGNPAVSVRRWRGVRVVRSATVLGYKRNLVLKLLNYLWFAFYNSWLALFVAPGHDRIFVFHTGPLTLAAPAALAARLYRIPMTVWTQDVWPDSVFAYGFSRRPVLEYLLGEFVRWVYRPAQTVLVSCEGFRASVSRFAPRSRVAFAPNWSTYRPAAGGEGAVGQAPAEPAPAAGAGFSFLFAGNVGKVQNLEIVVRAFARLAALDPSVRLDIVGDGSNLAALRRLAADLGCGGVIFHGRVPVESMDAHYRRADALIISLTKKPIFALTVPSKFQSYLAAGKPILAAMEGEVARIVAERGLGAVAAPDDEDAIAAALAALKGLGASERAAIGERAGGLLRSDYDRDAILARIKESL